MKVSGFSFFGIFSTYLRGLFREAMEDNAKITTIYEEISSLREEHTLMEQRLRSIERMIRSQIEV